MTKIFFFSPDGFRPMKDEILKSLITASHGWQDDGETWVYGFCVPHPKVDPSEVADRLEALGVDVLPGLRDPDDPEPKGRIISSLAKCGVVPGDKAKHIVKKMAAKSGSPLMRPHYF
jgi:hypothetical protein